MQGFVRNILLVCLGIFLVGCATGTYAPPMHSADKTKYSIELDKPFDTVWQDLIQYAAGTFFAIDNYEKDSGLITLSFGSNDPAQFITGGQWTAKNLSQSYSGDYVDFLHRYHGATLEGKMNIVVMAIDENRTRVQVNARYIFSAPPVQNVPGTVWSFDTGSCGTSQVFNPVQGTGNTRTICPTYKAEEAVLSALKQ
jgi:hypothetical protein